MVSRRNFDGGSRARAGSETHSYGQRRLGEPVEREKLENGAVAVMLFQFGRPDSLDAVEWAILYWMYRRRIFLSA
jgi:hypothetical protein